MDFERYLAFPSATMSYDVAPCELCLGSSSAISTAEGVWPHFPWARSQDPLYQHLWRPFSSMLESQTPLSAFSRTISSASWFLDFNVSAPNFDFLVKFSSFASLVQHICSKASALGPSALFERWWSHLASCIAAPSSPISISQCQPQSSLNAVDDRPLAGR